MPSTGSPCMRSTWRLPNSIYPIVVDNPRVKHQVQVPGFHRGRVMVEVLASSHFNASRRLRLASNYGGHGKGMDGVRIGQWRPT